MTTPSTEPVDIGGAIEYGWRKLWENVGPLLLAGLLVLVVTGLVGWFALAAVDNVCLRFLAGVAQFPGRAPSSAWDGSGWRS